jgi:hypothetical protein
MRESFDHPRKLPMNVGTSDQEVLPCMVVRPRRSLSIGVHASPSTNHAPADRPLALYKWQRLSPTDITHSPIPLVCKSITKLDLELSFFLRQDQSIQ